MCASGMILDKAKHSKVKGVGGCCSLMLFLLFYPCFPTALYHQLDLLLMATCLSIGHTTPALQTHILSRTRQVTSVSCSLLQTWARAGARIERLYLRQLRLAEISQKKLPSHGTTTSTFLVRLRTHPCRCPLLHVFQELALLIANASPSSSGIEPLFCFIVFIFSCP